MTASIDLEQSFYTIRFVELLSENIKRQHSTLTYILKRQYRDADKMYNFLLNGGEVELSFTSAYYTDVTSFLIDPILQRYDFQSKLVQFLVFFGLILMMCESYFGKSYRDKYREYMNKIRDIDIDYIECLLDKCNLLQSHQQELQIWKGLKKVHFTSKFHGYRD